MVASQCQGRRSRPEQLALLRPALIALCNERGFPQLTTAELLERANLAASDLEHDLATLEGCFCAVLEAERDDFFAYAERTVAGHSLWVERLRAFAYALLRHLRANPSRAHFLTVEIHRAGERAGLIWSKTIVAPLLDLIDQGRREAAAPARVSRTTAVAVAGAVFSRINLNAARSFDLPEEAIVPPLMSIAVLPYLGSEAAAAELRAPAPPDPDPGRRHGDAKSK